MRGEHVVEAAQRVEVEPVVVVDGRLVAEPLPDRMRVGIDLVVVGVVDQRSSNHDANGTRYATSGVAWCVAQARYSSA